MSSSTGVLTLPSSSLPFTFPFMNEVYRRCWRPRLNSWLGKIPWRRKWQPTPVFLPGKFHGQRSLAGNSPWGLKETDMTERLSAHTHTHTHTHTQPLNEFISSLPFLVGLVSPPPSFSQGCQRCLPKTGQMAPLCLTQQHAVASHCHGGSFMWPLPAGLCPACLPSLSPYCQTPS